MVAVCVVMGIIGYHFVLLADPYGYHHGPQEEQRVQLLSNLNEQQVHQVSVVNEVNQVRHRITALEGEFHTYKMQDNGNNLHASSVLEPQSTTFDITFVHEAGGFSAIDGDTGQVEVKTVFEGNHTC